MATTLIDLTGKRFGHWSVLQVEGKCKRGQEARWICRCDCGTVKSIKSSELRRGRTKSCGCAKDENAAPRQHYRDLVGVRFGRLVVESRADKDNIDKSGSDPYWNCVCDCGNRVIVKQRRLVQGDTRSCGCNAVEMRRVKAEETYGVSYQTINKKLTADEIVAIVNKDNAFPPTNNLEEVIERMFLPYWTSKVRNEQTTINRRNRRSKEFTSCELCGVKCAPQIHHIIPVCEYGGNDKSNILWLCGECHNKMHKRKNNKGDRGNAKGEKFD